MNPNPNLLKVDDVPEEQKKWMEPIINQLNGFQNSTLDVLGGKFSLSQNSVNDYFTVRVVGEKFPQAVRVGGGAPPTGALVARVLDAATMKPPVLASAPHVIFENKGDQILIRHIHGLTKNTAYLITILVLREQPSTPQPASAQANNAAVTTQTRPIPTELTNWTSFNPEWTAVTANPAIGNGTLAGFWRRIGDTLQARIKMIMGSTTTYGTGTWLWSVPNAGSIDAGKYPNGACDVNSDVDVLGKAGLLDSGTASYPAYVLSYSQKQVMIRPFNAAGTYAVYGGLTVTSAAPFTWAQNDQLVLDFEVPIVGWSAGDGT